MAENTPLKCILRNTQLAVHVDEGVDLLSNSKLIAASIIAVNKPSRPFQFSSPCRRRFYFPGPLYAFPGCLFPISAPCFKLVIVSSTKATTRQPRHKQAASHNDDAKSNSYIDCDLIVNYI